MKTLMAIAILACSLQPSNPLFDQIKKLEGSWTSADKEHPCEVTYKVSSGGTVLVETMSMHNAEMITVYHADGDALALTHYCMLGNQPRMRAAKDQKPGEIKFEGDGGTNMKPEDKHMHSLTVTFVDADHLRQDWSMYENGKDQGALTINLVRKK